MHAKTNAVAGLRDSLTKLDSFIGAANGEETTCAVFNTHPAFSGEEFTDEQRRSIRLYLETWVREPLSMALRSIEGDRSWEVESSLDFYGRR